MASLERRGSAGPKELVRQVPSWQTQRAQVPIGEGCLLGHALCAKEKERRGVGRDSACDAAAKVATGAGRNQRGAPRRCGSSCRACGLPTLAAEAPASAKTAGALGVAPGFAAGPGGGCVPPGRRLPQ